MSWFISIDFSYTILSTNITFLFPVPLTKLLCFCPIFGLILLSAVFIRIRLINLIMLLIRLIFRWISYSFVSNFFGYIALYGSTKVSHSHSFPGFILWDYISLEGGHFHNRHCIPKSLVFRFSSWLFSSWFFASPHVHKLHGCWNKILLLACRLPCTIEPIFLFYAISLLPYFGIQVSYDDCNFLRFAVLSNVQ